MLLPNCGPLPQMSHTCAMTLLQPLIFRATGTSRLRAATSDAHPLGRFNGATGGVQKDKRPRRLAESSLYLEAAVWPTRTPALLAPPSCGGPFIATGSCNISSDCVGFGKRKERSGDSPKKAAVPMAECAQKAFALPAAGFLIRAVCASLRKPAKIIRESKPLPIS
jgi:hypothetical protein